MIYIRLSVSVDTKRVLTGIQSYFTGMNNIEITDISLSCRSYESLESPIVETNTQAAGHVGDEQVYRRSATGDGKLKLLRYNGIPTIEFGFDTQTAHRTDEYTTTETLTCNVINYGMLPVPHEQLMSVDK